MAQFPTSIPGVDSISGSATLAAIAHGSRHNTDRAEIGALASKVGIDGSAVTSSHDYKLSEVTGTSKAETTANKDTDVALTANSDAKYPSQKAIKAYVDAAIIATKSALYPVGSLYTNTTSNTNPATLLGFGTWAAFSSGRVPVGIDVAQTEFDTIGKTGGAKTHTLTTAEIPSHNHVMGDAQAVAGGATVGVIKDGGTNRSTATTGSGGAHNNLQPYTVVYMWQRTA